MKVTFLIVGTQKGGTASLDSYLRQHSRIAMGVEKELRFFDQDRENLDFALYETRFEAKAGCLMKGEATPSYLFWPTAAQRIYDYNPEMKIVALLRNPIARSLSHWRMEVERGGEDTDFSSAIRMEPARLAIANNRGKKRRSYVERGRYAGQMRRFSALFPPSQLMFVKSETFAANPSRALDEVLSFLRVSRESIDTSRSMRVAHYDREMPEDDRVFLRGQFAEDIDFVERTLGWNCSDWI